MHSAAGPSTRIYHLMVRSVWEAFRLAGSYEPPSLRAEGFIHCSPADRVTEVARAFYRGQTDLVVLEIDPARLTARLINEPAADRPGSFPHIYGPLNLEAVVHAGDFPPDGKGWVAERGG